MAPESDKKSLTKQTFKNAHDECVTRYGKPAHSKAFMEMEIHPKIDAAEAERRTKRISSKLRRQGAKHRAAEQSAARVSRSHMPFPEMGARRVRSQSFEGIAACLTPASSPNLPRAQETRSVSRPPSVSAMLHPGSPLCNDSDKADTVSSATVNDRPG